MNRGSLILYLLLTYSSSCKWENNNPVDRKSTPLVNKTSENDIKGFLRTLESSDCVYGKSIDISGQQSTVYNCFLQLDKAFDDTTWFKLTSSSVPVVRVYAYNALMNRKSKLTLSARNRLMNDTAVVCYVSNDLKFEYSIGYYVSQLAPGVP